MTITRVAHSKQHSDATSHIVAKPTGTAENDVLLAFHANNGVRTSDQHTAPAGWTKIRGDDSTSPSNPTKASIWRKVAGASEPSSYSFGVSGVDSQHMGTVIVTYRGVDTTAIVDAQSGDAGTSAGTTGTAPSLTTTTTNCMIVFGVSFGVANEAVSLPMTEVSINAGSAAVVQGVAEEINPEADTFGPESATWTTSAGWTAQMVALTPEANPLFRLGSDTPDAIKLGSDTVDAAYLGSDQVWP